VDVALSLAQAARRGMPDSPYVAGTLAWAYYHEGAYATAIDLLTEALRKYPDNPNFHYHIGMAHGRSQDQQHATEHLERVLRINPSYAKAKEIRQTLASLGKG
jgi:cellulose synthase operon protein C